MPQIAQQESVLSGRGKVIQYANGNSAGKFFYKEYIKGERKYKSKEIVGASTIEEAKELAPQVAIELAQDAVNKPSLTTSIDPLSLIAREEKLQRAKEKLFKEKKKEEHPKINIEKALDDWLNQQEKRVSAGEFAQSSYEHKFNCCRHIRFYLRHKKLTLTNHIDESSFDDYCIFRLRDTDKRLIIQRELSVLGEFIKSYLVKNKYVEARLWMDGQFLPKIAVRQTDRDANPAINPEDWETIIKYIRNDWRKEAYNPSKLKSSNQFKKEVTIVDRKTEAKSKWFRTMFWHWILVAKNSGMSPEEICKLKWKNIEIVDVGRVSNTKAQEEWEQVMGEAQADGIDIEIEAPNLKDPQEWAIEGTEWGREERLIAYITTMRAKTQEYREIPCNLGHVFKRWNQFLKTQMNTSIKGEDYVFAQIFNEMKQPSQRRIGQTWRVICDLLSAQGKLNGHKFSDRPYTLYSMRSTFIENHILRGTDAYLLARICGNSVATIMQTYERIDIRRRTKELTDIEFGSKKGNPETISLFDE